MHILRKTNPQKKNQIFQGISPSEIVLIFSPKHFSFDNYAISVRTGGMLPIHVCAHAISDKNDPSQWVRHICIEEPFDLTNITHSVHEVGTFQRIKSTFLNCYINLYNQMDLEAVFKPQLNVPFNIYSLQTYAAPPPPFPPKQIPSRESMHMRA